MLRDRKDYPRLITPALTLIFPALNAPDFKFKKENGEYHARGRVDPDEPGLDKVIEIATKIRDEAYEAKKAELTRQKKGALLKELKVVDVLKAEVDQESGDETGKLILRAAMNARVVIKNGPRAGESFDKKPDFFDAKGKVLKNPPKLGSGSVVKLAVVPMDYETDGGKTIGTRFELEGVQILKVVAGGQRDAGFYGFGAEDGDEIEDGEAPQGGFADESGDDERDF